MEYLHEFATQAQCSAYMESEDYKEPFVGLIDETSGISYNNKENPLEKPLTFNITSGNGIIAWILNTEEEQATGLTIEYKLNDGEWTEITSEIPTGETPMDISSKIEVSEGDVVQFRGDNLGYGLYEDSEWGKFVTGNNFFYCTAYYNVEGNVMSLIDSDGFANLTTLEEPFALAYIFSRNTTLMSAENLLLPATSLSEGCYFGMFTFCNSITKSPLDLPATTLSDYCYAGMFEECPSLITVPTLQATTLAKGCYSTMFIQCSSLVDISSNYLPVTTLADECYYSMFQGCTSLVSAPDLPATTLVNQCYYSMFQGCTSLVSAPVLSATAVVSGSDASCMGMFMTCTALTTAPTLAITDFASSTGCFKQMFQGCTSLTTAPVLPATTLVNNCYDRMFYNCTNLNYIKCLATDNSAYECTNNWTSGVSATGTFVKNPNMSSWATGANGIPSGWTVEGAIS